jgi:uncharacterized protein YukE
MPIKKVKRTIIPPEAPRIAAEFRKSATEVRMQASRLRGVQGTLDSTWQGNSKNNFMSNFCSEPGNAESYASWLESKASEIENMTVVIWEDVFVP